jgi:hypothetical protein
MGNWVSLPHQKGKSDHTVAFFMPEFRGFQPVKPVLSVVWNANKHNKQDLLHASFASCFGFFLYLLAAVCGACRFR